MATESTSEFTQHFYPDFRVWIICPYATACDNFVHFREGVLSALERRKGLEQASIHFVVVLDNPTNTENLDKFVSLPSVTILRSPEPVENDRALMFALRSLRGTIREEDLIITAHSEKTVVLRTYSSYCNHYLKRPMTLKR